MLSLAARLIGRVLSRSSAPRVQSHRLMGSVALEQLRGQVATTIRHATDLLGALTSLDDALHTLTSSRTKSVAGMTDAERATFVARLCGYDPELPERLRVLIESLADVLSGLTATDQGRAWFQHHLARLEAGDDEAA